MEWPEVYIIYVEIQGVLNVSNLKWRNNFKKMISLWTL